jgi:hypothetical protein
VVEQTYVFGTEADVQQAPDDYSLVLFRSWPLPEVVPQPISTPKNFIEIDVLGEFGGIAVIGVGIIDKDTQPQRSLMINASMNAGRVFVRRRGALISIMDDRDPLVVNVNDELIFGACGQENGRWTAGIHKTWTIEQFEEVHSPVLAPRKNSWLRSVQERLLACILLLMMSLFSVEILLVAINSYITSQLFKGDQVA